MDARHDKNPSNVQLTPDDSCGCRVSTSQPLEQPIKGSRAYKPRYSGPGATGICVCGCSWEKHHLGVVMNGEHAKATGEAYIPEECERYGFNETGGLGPSGENRCHSSPSSDPQSLWTERGAMTEKEKLWEAMCDYCRIDGPPVFQSGTWMHKYADDDSSPCDAGKLWQAATLAERERCAQVCQNYGEDPGSHLAEVIRKGGA